MPPIFKSLPYSRKMTFPTTSLLMFYLETILKRLQKDINWLGPHLLRRLIRRTLNALGFAISSIDKVFICLLR